jgi:hypothetical protein
MKKAYKGVCITIVKSVLLDLELQRKVLLSDYYVGKIYLSYEI